MIGKIIFSYRIVKLLGEGGMGNVYLAENTHNAEQKAAIKCLLPQLARHESLRDRFKMEAETLHYLIHPNIVKLITFIEDTESAYIIMEFVEAVDLSRYIKNESGPIPAEQALAIMKQILDGIGFAHKQNVIHRDIKPSNILLTPDGHVKIIDFGIAKVMSEADKKLTKTGMQMGAVFYMSPEQVRGKNVDSRSDIYSLGVTFFQMISGQSPYESITTEFDVYNKIVSDPLPLVTSIYPGALSAFDKVIAKATAKNPDQRYATTEEFSLALSEAFKNAGDEGGDGGGGGGTGGGTGTGGEEKKKSRWMSFEGITAIVVFIILLCLGGWQCSVHASYKKLVSDAKSSYDSQSYYSAANSYERAAKVRKSLWFDRGEDLSDKIADCNVQLYKAEGMEALKADSFSLATSPDYKFTAAESFSNAKRLSRYGDEYIDKHIQLCDKIKKAMDEYSGSKLETSSDSYLSAIQYAREIGEDQVVIDHLSNAWNFVRTPQVRFMETTTTANVYKDGRRGMNIHFNFKAYFLKGAACNLAVWFYNDKGERIDDYDKSFYTTDGQVATSETFNPGYVSAVYDNFVIFMPYDELDGETYGTFQFDAGAFNSGKKVGSCEKVVFRYEAPKF